MRKLYLFAIFLVIYEFTVYSANDMIMPGMLAVVKQFNAPLSYVAGSLSLFMFGQCVIQLWLGPLAERYGKRQIILLGNLAFLIFTIIIATSINISQFMLGRWLQGTGMAFIAMGYALIHEKFDDKSAVKLLALMGNVSILAPLLGPLIGTIIVSYSNWHYIFVLSAMLSLISLTGLFIYTPQSSTKIDNLQIKPILKHYYAIMQDKNFTFGIICTSLGAMPLLIWIGLAPNLILHNLKLNYNSYIIYQIITIGGVSVSSIFMQFLAGRWQFHQLILRGFYIGLAGVIFSFTFHSSINLLAIGLFFYGVGLGLSNGSIIRIIISNTKFSQSMSASLMTFSQSLFFTIGLEISDFICSKFNYSALSFTACCVICTLTNIGFIKKFAYLNRERQWQ